MKRRQLKVVYRFLIGAALLTSACQESRPPDETLPTSITDTHGISGGSTGGAADTTGGAKLDVGGTGEDVPGNCVGDGGGGGGGAPAFSYIWISNSEQGTVSKIDTVTLAELGRYRTRADGLGDPSRTSVNLNGDVAVANRNGGLVKFFARESDCIDRSGDGVIQTSSGANDVLPWDEEECRAWFTPLDYASNRPVAWTPGELNHTTCRWENSHVWTSGTNDGFTEDTPECFEMPDLPQCQGPGEEGEGVDVVLVDGDSGEIEQRVNIPEILPEGFGLYGGAVDVQGNFWGSQVGGGDLVRVNLDDFEYEIWPIPVSGYGMTVDHKGNVWVCSEEVGRFDPTTQTWATAMVGGSGGCMEDGQGTLWLASYGLVGVNIDTLEVVKTLSVGSGEPGEPGEPAEFDELDGYVHGVSIDFYGYVWGVEMGDRAHRVDPDTGDIETYSGLFGAYTYSDMTGFALANAGGWTPAG